MIWTWLEHWLFHKQIRRDCVLCPAMDTGMCVECGTERRTNVCEACMRKAIRERPKTGGGFPF